MNAAMVELFMRSAGAPPAVIELFRKFRNEGFGAFQTRPMAADDPNWSAIGANPDRLQRGMWLRAEGKSGRITAAIFFEGDDDEIFKRVAAMAVPASLPGGGS